MEKKIQKVSDYTFYESPRSTGYNLWNIHFGTKRITISMLSNQWEYEFHIGHVAQTVFTGGEAISDEGNTIVAYLGFNINWIFKNCYLQQDSIKNWTASGSCKLLPLSLRLCWRNFGMFCGTICSRVTKIPSLLRVHLCLCSLELPATWKNWSHLEI